MKLKTSTKISLKFTILSFVIIVIFSLIISFVFFRTRYFKQKEMLIHDRAYEKPFFLNVIEKEQKVKRDKKSDENFKPFPNRREIVQEIPLSELKTDAYYCLETLQSLTQ